MAVVLFYSPFVRRARDVESVLFALKANGHRVLSLNFKDGSDYSKFVKDNGIETYSHDFSNPGSAGYLIRHIIYLVKFCRKHNIEFVFSHLDTPNFIASVVQYFIKAKVFICRHHIDEAQLYNYNQSLTYRLTNKLSKHVIVVSERARDYMSKVEHVQIRKIMHIDLGYDFSLYAKPDRAVVAKIREDHASRLLLITIGRLTKYKRIDVSIELTKELKHRGISVSLLILGDGPLRSELENTVEQHDLKDCVFFQGQIINVLDYLAAADVVIHPSELESSCVVIKEAGLLSKPVFVCKNIGDFNSYIVNNVNGFLLDSDNFSKQALTLIVSDAWKDHGIGVRLRESILRKFDISAIIPQYLKLLCK